jgi:hypothetical protein
MERSLISFSAGAIVGLTITVLLSFGLENWFENPTALVLGITSTASKIWLIFYYAQLLPILVISGLTPLQKRFKAKRLVPLSFGLGQAMVMITITFLSFAIELLT